MCANQVSAVLSALEGPFACVVWDPVRKEIWFARDALGRRSLVAAWSGSTLVVASVSCEGMGWCEIFIVLLMILNLTVRCEIPPGLYSLVTEVPTCLSARP